MFILASNLHNLGKSAKICNLSQSAASMAIQRVESSLAIKLCDHKKRIFSLTKTGQILLPKFEKWVNELKLIIETENQHPIKISTSHSIAQVMIPNILDLDNGTVENATQKINFFV